MAFAAFSAPAGPSPTDEPAGVELIAALRVGLAADGWTCSEPDLWRGGGWSVVVGGEQQTQVVLVAADGESPDRWALMVEPVDPRGWLARRFGAPMASPSLRELTGQLHELLPTVGGSRVTWTLNADPFEGGVDHPDELAWEDG